MKLACTGGRYPGSLIPPYHDRRAVTCTMQQHDSILVLRIEDDLHPERWEQFTVQTQDLIAWLGRRGLACEGQEVLEAGAEV